MDTILFVINDAPYGTEKMFNSLRLAMNLIKEYKDEVDIKFFLLGDAVNAVLPDQELPSGYYNIEKMLKYIINNGGDVKACGSCVKARGLKDIELISGVEVSTMSQLSEWTIKADKVFTF